MSELAKCLKAVSESINSDLYLFNSTVDYSSSDTFIKTLRERRDGGKIKENCGLILTTMGGDPDAGYRIVRAIRRYYRKLTLYVFGSCKSTGTLMALGADEIVMSDFGEFGPLDIQLTKEDELLNTSGLSYLQSLTSLSDQIFKSFEKNFLGVLQRSGYSITTKTAAEISSKLAIGLISPISAQIDPIRLGEVHRAITIANGYGDRLCEESELIAKLIVGYPSHGFVIDYEEARAIFKNVRWVKDDEIALEQLLLDSVLREQENSVLIVDLMTLVEEIKETETNTEPSNVGHVENGQHVDKPVDAPALERISTENGAPALASIVAENGALGLSVKSQLEKITSGNLTRKIKTKSNGKSETKTKVD